MGISSTRYLVYYFVMSLILSQTPQLMETRRKPVMHSVEAPTVALGARENARTIQVQLVVTHTQAHLQPQTEETSQTLLIMMGRSPTQAEVR